MLNIPDSVKTLFKQDGVRKNFRVHFPNGELPDITNDNIVQESVKFTSSICSQDVLKFGLTEASVLEFETVGIGNMYGMTIDAGIEIDLSSLSAAQLSEIASGTWDGVYVDSADSDIGFAYFRVPYGQFRIDSCPRDHQAMTHRKVTAYGASPLKVRNNPFELKKQSTLNLPSVYNANMFNLTTEIMAYNMPETIGSFTETELSVSRYNQYSNSISSPAALEFEKSISVPLTGGGSKSVGAIVSFRIAYSTGGGRNSDPYKLTTNALFSAKFNGSYFTVVSTLANALENDPDGIDLSGTGFTNWIDLAKSFFVSDNGINYLYPGVGYYLDVTTVPGSVVTGFIEPYQKVDLESSCPVFYPYVGDYTEEIQSQYYDRITNNGIYEIIIVPTSFYVVGGSTEYVNKAVPIPTFKLLEPTQTIPTATFPFPSTGTGSVYYGRVHVTMNANSYKPDGDLIKIVNSWLELQAKFGRANLQGAFDELQLSKGDPVSVSPGLFEEFWWDEYDVLPVGRVVYKLKVKEGESETEKEFIYEFGDGASIYDMSDNIILSSCADEQEANALLDEYFIPNLDPICFTPIDLTMKGLPYLEAGDYLAVTAEDGTIAYSFNMRETISGIQVLTAEIESTSGDIIESEEAGS